MLYPLLNVRDTYLPSFNNRQQVTRYIPASFFTTSYYHPYPLPIVAFYPTKFRANLSKIPGISHEQMTEEVLTSVASSLFPPVISSLQSARGVPLSRRMLEARTSIVQSNVWIDWGYPIPEWHFAGESDAESAMILESVKASLVKHLAEGDVDAARINLGQALHLVQDYFAYR